MSPVFQIIIIVSMIIIGLLTVVNVTSLMRSSARSARRFDCDKTVKEAVNEKNKEIDEFFYLILDSKTVNLGSAKDLNEIERSD